ncbi:MAG TPA: hypothetical protein VLA43_15225 [Longimicrobiales bacterium]|nr:hypothetical protein [Longimicrobiales bacterium]
MSTAQPALQMEDTGTVRKALRRLKGRATVGDVAAATGLAQPRAEAALRSLLEMHRGHLEVGERGDLVYRFEPSLIRRDAVPLLTRLKEGAWSIFKAAFKIWIVAMLVIYFVVFVALMIAALLANNRDGDGGGLGGGGERRGGGHVHFPNFWLWYLIWSPNWGWGRPYYGDRYGRSRPRRRGERPQGPPFYKKVFAFVFGPDRPETSPERRDREYLRFIRSRQGAVSAVDLVQATGMELDEAESELARLMAAHDGDVQVTEDGTLVYLFPSLMVSAHGSVREREVPAAWRRLEPKLPLTGNGAGSNAVIAGINTFNLAAAATAPWFIFPRLGLGGPVAEIGLVWVPIIFSVSFFAVPLLRAPAVWRENARRAARNVRKAVLGLVSRASLGGTAPDPVGLDQARALVEENLKGSRHRSVDLTRVMDRMVAEFDGEVEVTADGTPRFRFPGFRAAMAAAHRLRVKLGLGGEGVGRIVYTSDDDAAAQGARDLESFDRELAAGAAAEVAAGPESPDSSEPLALPAPDALAQYMADPDRLAFRDELELAALEDEMRRQATAQTA